MKQRQRFRFVYVLFPILLSLILYAQSLISDFVWDDRSLILQNSLVLKPEKMLETFRYSLTIFGEDYGYYRPLSLISFALDNFIWRENAFGFHLTNLLLHILVVICLVYAFQQLFGFTQGVLISIVYTTFAVHIENVVFISGRMDILATLLMLLTLIIYFSAKNLRTFHIILCYIFILLALLSKEIALIFPLIFILAVINFFHPELWKKHIQKGGLFIGSALLTYIILRVILLKSLVPVPVTSTSFLNRVIAVPRLIVFYLQLLLFPYNLNARHYEFVLNNAQFINLIFSAIVLIIIIFIIIRLRKQRQIVFGGLWFLIGLLPVMNIFPLSGIPVAERFLYFPSIGIAILLTGLLPTNEIVLKASDLKNFIIKVILLSIIINNIIFSFKRVPVWRKEEIFFKTMVAQNPKSPLAHHNLGHYYYRQGNWKKAEEEYKNAITINPYFPAPHASLGDIYTRTGRYQEAINEYDIYLRLLPNAPNRMATISRIKELQNLLNNVPEE